jgi:hypothetical protein
MTDDERASAIERLIEDAVVRARQAFSDLTIEQKFLALDRLEAWLEYEWRLTLPEAEQRTH